MKTSETRIRRLLVVGTVGAAIAAAVNTAIYAVGRAAGVDYVVKASGADAGSVRLVDVLSLTLMSFAIGIAIAVVVTLVKRPSLRAVQVLGAGVAIVTIYGDFTIDGGTAAKALLASMHIVAGAVFVASLQVARVSSARPTRAAASLPPQARVDTVPA